MKNQVFILTLLLTICFVICGTFGYSQNSPDPQDGPPKDTYEYDAAGNRVLRRIHIASDGRLAAPEETQPTTEELAQQEGFAINAYPNPAVNLMNVDVSPSILELEEHRLTLSDMNGRIILQQQITNTRTQLDVSALANGNYVLKVWAKEHSEVWQVVKK